MLNNKIQRRKPIKAIEERLIFGSSVESELENVSDPFQINCKLDL